MIRVDRSFITPVLIDFLFDEATTAKKESCVSDQVLENHCLCFFVQVDPLFSTVHEHEIGNALELFQYVGCWHKIDMTAPDSYHIVSERFNDRGSQEYSDLNYLVKYAPSRRCPDPHRFEIELFIKALRAITSRRNRLHQSSGVIPAQIEVYI